MVIDIISLVLVVAGFGASFQMAKRFRWKGVVCGALTLWSFGFLALTAEILDTEDGPGLGVILIPAWLFSGWFFSGIFCLAVREFTKPPKA